MAIQFLKEGVVELEVGVKKQGYHCLMAYVHHKAVSLLGAVLVREVNDGSEVLHALLSANVGEAVWTHNEAVEGL